MRCKLTAAKWFWDRKFDLNVERSGRRVCSLSSLHDKDDIILAEDTEEYSILSFDPITREDGVEIGRDKEEEVEEEEE